MVALFRKCQQGSANRRNSGLKRSRTVAALERRHGVLELALSRKAVRPVGNPLILSGVRLFKILVTVEEDRRCLVYRRCNCPYRPLKCLWRLGIVFLTQRLHLLSRGFDDRRSVLEDATQRRRSRNEVKQSRQLQSDTSSCRLWIRFSW